MAISSELILTIAFEAGVIAISTIASFFIPGLVGLIASGAIQFLGDLGIEFQAGGIPSDITWFVSEFLLIFAPFFREFKFAKESKLLASIEKTTKQAKQVLSKIDNALVDAIESLKKMPGKQFSPATGLTKDLENDVQKIEQQEVAREKFGTDKVRVKDPIISFTPNTKNFNSWIAGVGFTEKTRFGPRDIRGDLIVVYYTNNANRVGFALKPIEDIVLGRTSAGESVSGSKTNKDRYKKLARDISPDGLKTRTVIFKNASYFSDYLGFCKAGSWGGYYMRRWMIGEPGKKGKTNILLLFGSIWRVKSKAQSLLTQGKGLLQGDYKLINNQVKKVIRRTQFGSAANKVVGAFRRTKSIESGAIIRTTIKKRGSRVRRNVRRKSIS